MPLVRYTAFFTDTSAQPDDTVARLAINIATFLTVLCWIFLMLFLISRLTPTLRAKFVETLGDKSFFLVWLIPTVAMIMSLFFSEFLGWTPCKLCWYQRIFMYSLALLMLIYWFKRNAWLRRVGYVLAAIGAPISFYHIGIEPQFSWFEESTSCNPTAPCSVPWFFSLKYLTTAGMALTAFITIIALLYMTSKVTEKTDSNVE